MSLSAVVVVDDVVVGGGCASVLSRLVDKVDKVGWCVRSAKVVSLVLDVIQPFKVPLTLSSHICQPATFRFNLSINVPTMWNKKSCWMKTML